MNVLIVGSGGREHALAWKVAQSPRVGQVFVAPGNAGSAREAGVSNVAIDVMDFAALAAFAKANGVGLTIIGPEAPLVGGIVDHFRAEGLRCFGPTQGAAQLEGSKAFTKDFLSRHGIPTAEYQTFTEIAPAEAYIRAKGAPIVVKADGLAAGKGVILADTVEQAITAVHDMLAGNAFGAAGSRVVVEEFLRGEEASFIVMVDGKNVLPLATSQDHKARDDGDQGPNTGGMGAYSPATVLTPALTRQVMDEIILPSIRTMKARGTPFQGVLFAGLMLTASGPKLIEYNVRFGDPECEVMMPRLKSDLLAVLEAAATQNLHSINLEWHDTTALTVVYAAKGYPATPEKGSEIRNLDQAGQQPDSLIFHAGTAQTSDGRIVANGGRVLAVTGFGTTVTEAKARATAALDVIDWPGGFHRTDIGWREIKREQDR